MKKLIGTGSTRKVFFSGSIDLVLNNIKTTLNVCEKIPVTTRFDNRQKNIHFGKLQNKNEYNKNLDSHRILTKIDRDEYVINKRGILTPIFEYNNNKIKTLMVEPYITNNNMQDEMDCRMSMALKTELFHNIEISDFHEAAMEYEIKKENKNFLISNKSKYIFENHYVGISLKDMIEKSYISGYDITDANWGIFTNPHDGRDFPVLLDYGMTNKELTLLSKLKEALHQESRN